MQLYLEVQFIAYRFLIPIPSNVTCLFIIVMATFVYKVSPFLYACGVKMRCNQNLCDMGSIRAASFFLDNFLFYAKSNLVWKAFYSLGHSMVGTIAARRKC